MNIYLYVSLYFFFSHVEMACGVILVVLKKVSVVVRRLSKGESKLPIFSTICTIGQELPLNETLSVQETNVISQSYMLGEKKVTQKRFIKCPRKP